MSEQMSIYQAKRQVHQDGLNTLYKLILNTMFENQGLRKLKTNDLIRHIWKVTGVDWAASSIIRLANQVRRDYPDLDTEENQEERANSETSYHEWNNNRT